MVKFSVGDRVESLCQVGNYGRVGSPGTIVTDYKCDDWEVEFDDDIGGWGEGDRHWLMNERDLAPIEDPIDYSIEDLFAEGGEYHV